jgi:hypothetical protein
LEYGTESDTRRSARMTFEIECPACGIGVVVVQTGSDEGEQVADVVEGCSEGCILNPLDTFAVQDEAMSAERESASWR